MSRLMGFRIVTFIAWAMGTVAWALGSVKRPLGALEVTELVVCGLSVVGVRRHDLAASLFSHGVVAGVPRRSLQPLEVASSGVAQGL